jgi:hypothetical protein
MIEGTPLFNPTGAEGEGDDIDPLQYINGSLLLFRTPRFHLTHFNLLGSVPSV